MKSKFLFHFKAYFHVLDTLHPNFLSVFNPSKKIPIDGKPIFFCGDLHELPPVHSEHLFICDKTDTSEAFVRAKFCYNLILGKFDLEALHQRCSVKKVFLEISQDSQEKHLCQSLFFNKDSIMATCMANGNLQNTSVGCSC